MRERNIERFRGLNWCDLEKFDPNGKENGISFQLSSIMKYFQA